MSTWLYQINQTNWPPSQYRLDIWEGQIAQWPLGRKVLGAKNKQPAQGDIVVFFYAKSKGNEPGFYGWAVITQLIDKHSEMNFRPVSPSDHLKMNPWWNKDAELLTNRIRGDMKQGTLFFVNENDAKRIRNGIAGWLSRKSSRKT